MKIVRASSHACGAGTWALALKRKRQRKGNPAGNERGDDTEAEDD